LKEFSSVDTYTSNRRIGWTYDANGNWLTGGGRQHTYDAAGKSTSTSWTGGSFSETFDGNGQRVKSTQLNLPTYYLRSSVLGGQVVEELNSSGGKQQAFIYTQGRVVGQNGIMLHGEPSGVRVLSSVPQSTSVNSFSELDPWGAEVFMEDPYLDDPEFGGGRGESGPVYLGYGDISRPSTGCIADGVYTLCDLVRSIESLALLGTEGGKSKQDPTVTFALGIKIVWVAEDTSSAVTHLAGTQDSSMTIYSGPGGHFEFVDTDPLITSTNPDTLQSDRKNKDCSIEVAFDTNKKVQVDGVYPPAGTSIVNTRSGPVYGVGFVVTVSVPGGIGRIGTVETAGTPIVNPKDPTGAWTVQQYRWRYGNTNTGIYESDVAAVDELNARVPFRYQKYPSDGSTLSWYDHPGMPYSSLPDNHLRWAVGQWKFVVKAVNGKKQCSVSFSINVGFHNGRWSARWGQN